ncbi:hypothetical protein D3C87_1301120 [compost metagenome]
MGIHRAVAPRVHRRELLRKGEGQLALLPAGQVRDHPAAVPGADQAGLPRALQQAALAADRDRLAGRHGRRRRLQRLAAQGCREIHPDGGWHGRLRAPAHRGGMGVRGPRRAGSRHRRIPRHAVSDAGGPERLRVVRRRAVREWPVAKGWPAQAQSAGPARHAGQRRRDDLRVVPPEQAGPPARPGRRLHRARRQLSYRASRYAHGGAQGAALLQRDQRRPHPGQDHRIPPCPRGARPHLARSHHQH